MTSKGIDGNYGKMLNKKGRGLYLISHTEISEDVYVIKEKLRRIQLEVDRLIKLIERIK